VQDAQGHTFRPGSEQPYETRKESYPDTVDELPLQCHGACNPVGCHEKGTQDEATGQKMAEGVMAGYPDQQTGGPYDAPGIIRSM